MRKSWVLFCVLNSFVHLPLWGNVLLPSPENPGFFGSAGATLLEGLPTSGGSPAKYAETLTLALLWGRPAVGVDLQNYSLLAEWGNSRYRVGSFFSVTAMDSIYRSTLWGLEVAKTCGMITVGVGHSVNVEYVPGLSSWWTQQTKAGVGIELPGNFSVGGLLLYPYEEGFQYLGGLHWKASQAYQLFFEMGPHLLHIGHFIDFGSFRLQNAYTYPSPSLGIGIVVSIDSFGVGFGFQRVNEALDAQGASLIWRKKCK
jgi:hypothetical protein